LEIKLQVDDESGGLLTSETLDVHYEFLMVDLIDGTRVTQAPFPETTPLPMIML